MEEISQQGLLLGGVVLVVFIWFWAMRLPSAPIAVEGMATKSKSGGSSFVGASAADYADAVKAEVVQMQDVLLISKYRDDYEQSLVNLDELIDLSLINESMGAVQSGSLRSSSIAKIAELQSAKAGIASAIEALGDS